MADETKKINITADDEATQKGVADEFGDALKSTGTGDEHADDATQVDETQAQEQPPAADDAELKKWRDLSRKNEDAKKKALADLAAANARIKALEEREQLAAVIADVSQSTGVPASLLRGSTKEEIEAHAKAIAEAYAKPAAPNNPDAGKFAGKSSAAGISESPEQAQIRALADQIARQIGAIE